MILQAEGILANSVTFSSVDLLYQLDQPTCEMQSLWWVAL